MKIRSATLGIPLAWPPEAAMVERAGRGLAGAMARFGAAGWTVQTTRLALPPFPAVLGWREPERVPALARWLGAHCAAAEIGYASLGPVLADAPADAAASPAAFAATIPTALAQTETVFAAVALDGADGVRAEMALAAAAVIVQVARTSPDGFGNLRFAALARCPAGIPFLPAAYHDGGPPSLALALEAADLAQAAFADAPSVDAAQARLTAAVEDVGGRLAAVVEGICVEQGWRFGGLDLSLAPFPDLPNSIAAALERLGLECFGAFGTLYAARCVTEALRRARLPRCGFSGLMLPLLEDRALADAAAAGRLSVNDLLLYSAVCGTGLDTIPLPGDVSEGELAALLLDVATLAVALDKPLTARLLPIPGQAAGQLTAFDFPFFANTRILPTRGIVPTALLRRAVSSPPPTPSLLVGEGEYQEPGES
ncbi:MAG TPA: DUF711 family protein [Chloroflexota bacterium]|nr:DUF711 family protein [Chloroflexota bacterium]